MMHYIGEFLAWPSNTGVVGSDLGFLGIIGVLIRHISCHEKGCWRIGHHVNGTIVCHKHRKDRVHV